MKFHVVRYEDLANDPAQSLKDIVSAFGLSWDDGMLRFWERPMHALNGNAGAYMWYPGFNERVLFERKEDRHVAIEYATRSFGGWTDDKWYGSCNNSDVALLTMGSVGNALQRLSRDFGYDIDELLDLARCRTPAGRGIACRVRLA